jgi:hypothetical protein
MTKAESRERGWSFFQLAPALIGLLGVLIGAAATSGVTYLGNHRHDKADERGAERLVLAEVMSDDALMNAKRPQTDRLTDAEWRAEREHLARWLSNTEWAWVAKYYRDLEKAKSTGPPVPIKDRSCTLVALNVGRYSNSPYFTVLSNIGSCKKVPGKTGKH